VAVLEPGIDEIQVRLHIIETRSSLRIRGLFEGCDGRCTAVCSEPLGSHAVRLLISRKSPPHRSLPAAVSD
jgi:hypothetical protein